MLLLKIPRFAELVLDESPVDDPDTVVVEGDGVVSATVNVAGNLVL